MSQAPAKKAGLPWWLKLLLLLFVVIALGRACDPRSGSVGTSTPRGQDRVATAASAVTAEAERVRAEAALKQECSTTLHAQKQKYAALMKERKYWEAAQAVRICSQALGTPELAKLLREAEISSHLSDINSPKVPPRDKARAIQALARDYPEVGAKYEAQATKLVLEADRLDQEAEKKRKRSEGVSIGMSKEDVLASSWGRPQSINTTTTTVGTREQWIYGGRNYLYFENGRLTAIQN